MGGTVYGSCCGGGWKDDDDDDDGCVHNGLLLGIVGVVEFTSCDGTIIVVVVGGAGGAVGEGIDNGGKSCGFHATVEEGFP
jgi:hypothetical protein